MSSLLIERSRVSHRLADKVHIAPIRFDPDLGSVIPINIFNWFTCMDGRAGVTVTKITHFSDKMIMP